MGKQSQQEELSFDSDDSSEKTEAPEGSSNLGGEAAKHEQASFTATYKGIEALFYAKLKKYSSLKALCVAEAKLSLSAILAITLSIVAMFMFVLTCWLLLNVAVGVGFYKLFGSIIGSVLSLFVLNVICIVILFWYATRIYAHIGVPNTVAALKKV